MKTKMRSKWIYITLCYLFIFCIFPCYIFAAGSFSVRAGSTSLMVGETTTVTISTSNCAGAFSIRSSNPGVATVSSAYEWVDGSTNITINTHRAGSATITVTAEDVADTDIESVTGSKSVTIQVTEPVNQEPEPQPKPPVNNQNNNNQNNNNQNNNNQNVYTKNSNTYLSYLELSEEGMTPSFVKTKTSYAITVGVNVNEIQVSASPEASTSYVEVSGNTDLKEGDNTINVIVTAENGATRTYYITVTKTADKEKANAYLENLIIENLTLAPTFQSEVFIYDLGKVEQNITKLNILTFPKNEKAKVEIQGNDELKVGENEIKIIVTAEDGSTKKEYILKVTREGEEIIVSDPLKEVQERSSSKKFSDFMGNLWLSIKSNALLVLMYAFILVEFVQIVYLYRKLGAKEELLEKYGISEDGEITETRSGKRREIEIQRAGNMQSKMDFPLEMEEDSTIDQEEKKEKDVVKFSDKREKVDSTDLEDHEEE